MPRYLVERTFPDGLAIPLSEAGAQAMQGVVAINAEQLVTWVHSYVTPDRKHTFCVYDAPTPEAELVKFADLPGGRAEQAAGRSHHRGARARSLLLPVRARRLQ